MVLKSEENMPVERYSRSCRYRIFLGTFQEPMALSLKYCYDGRTLYGPDNSRVTYENNPGEEPPVRG